jgi:hypothetical protein
MRLFAPIVLCLFVSNVTFSQEKLNIKFGKITSADFEVTSPLIDSNTNAIVIADVGDTKFVGNLKGWFSLVFKRNKRIKILNKNGFDAANISISLYTDNNETEKLEDLQAQTYNLENNKVVTTKLSLKEVFDERVRKSLLKKKFTMPSVKEGSIIDISYTIKSDFLFNLQPWEFQNQYPCLWSEYNLGLPEIFNYILHKQGNLVFDVNQITDGSEIFAVRSSTGVTNNDDLKVNTPIQHRKWVIKNSPGLKEEVYVSSVDNYCKKLEFQLSEYRFPQQPVEQIMESWPKVAKKLMEREDFGLAISKSNDWLNVHLKLIIKEQTKTEEKVKSIYEYLRENFSITSNYGITINDNNSLKEVFKKKNGTTSEINLLLIAMLKHENIDCEPVLVSLRNRGKITTSYPLIDRFNYLICEVPLKDKVLYLDASVPMLGFNKLQQSCYNGNAWSITTEIQKPINFLADSLKEISNTSVFLSNDEHGMLSGTFSKTLGDNASLKFREKMNGSTVSSLKSEISKDLIGDIKIDNIILDSLKFYDAPITIRYTLKLQTESDLLYLNPMFGESIIKNPFAAAKRNYAIEMPYTKKDQYLLNMEIPKGYEVEELPKSEKFKLNNDDGYFEYLVENKAGRIQIRSRVFFNKANFPVENYESLREFYSIIIKKQGEQIVLKKTK